MDRRLARADITAPLLLQTLRRIEDCGANETAHTLRQTTGQWMGGQLGGARWDDLRTGCLPESVAAASRPL